ncbi:MAG: hypothetical protein JO345_34995 [Streptosporangiaceae bacterium]|nr:hypothetical protein [Streptosporangiaceae bacterium]
MKWWYLVTGLVAAFVAGSAIALAIRQGSWGPVVSVAWLPAVFAGVRPGSSRRCVSLCPRFSRRRAPVR